MLDSELDDTHLCIKCNATIVGLNNYIEHRKINCSVKALTINRDIEHENHAYGTFDFPVPATKDDKTFNFNYDIHHSDDDRQQPVDKNSGSFKSTSDPNKSLTDQYDYHYGLGADVFFSSLELQSSSKLKSIPSTSKQSSVSGRVRTRKTTANTNTSADNDDMWINPTSVGSDKLLKAVSEISGSKKVDSMFSLIRFTQDSPEPYEDEDEDDEDYHEPQRIPTGGKWKPSEHGLPERHRLITNSPHWFERDHWEINEDHPSNEDSIDFLQPPPCYTKGKWVPGTKIVKLDYKPDPKPTTQSSEKYWCSTCNRKLTSLVIYERHLKSNLHLKRSQPENELEEASRPLPLASQSKRIIKPSIYLNETMYASRHSRKKTLPSSTVTSTSGSGPNSKIEEPSDKRIKKRQRRRYYVKCEICKTRLPKFLLGKHLISHYHYRRMLKQPNRSFNFILENIHRIVLQAPFQCNPCRFYANTEEMFIKHWHSKEHASQTEGPGRFWCCFCKFECDDNIQMQNHLVEEDHQEVVLAINRSVPIIIRKRSIITCPKCHQEFYFNMQLRQHSINCSGASTVGTASNKYQSKYICSECKIVLKSRMSLQIHNARKHDRKAYFCSPCDLTFKTAGEAKKHRTSTEHKITSAKLKSVKNLAKKCTVCNEVLADVLKLKEHLWEKHPKDTYSCCKCGQCFTLPQELSRHVRDKQCKPIESLKPIDSSNTEKIETVAYQTVQILPTYTIIIPTNTITTTTAAVAATNTSSSCPKETSTEIYLCHNSTSQLLPDEEPANDPQHNFIKDESSDNRVIDETVPSNSVLTTSDTPAVQVKKQKGSNEKDSDLFHCCNHCEFRTQSKFEYLFHKTLHLFTNLDSNTKIPCPICGKPFKKPSLRLHLKQHTNERNFKCEICPTAFTRRSNLRDHIKKIHCGDHKRISDPEKQFICSMCSKAFQRKHLLEQHFHCHRNQMVTKSFPCAVNNCLYSGRSAAELRNHVLSHSDEKNYECGFRGCTYKGKSMSLLKRHCKIHEPEIEKQKDHKCTYCEFETRISSHLKRHMRIHTGEKPYKCPHCDYTSNSSENLRKHVLVSKIHPGKCLYECKFCAETGTLFETNHLKEFKIHLSSAHAHQSHINLNK